MRIVVSRTADALPEEANCPFVVFGARRCDGRLARRLMLLAGSNDRRDARRYKVARFRKGHAEIEQHERMVGTLLMVEPQDAQVTFQFLRTTLGRLVRVREDLLVLPNGRHLSSVDRGITGYRTRHILAGIYAELGDFAKAEALWRHVLQEAPSLGLPWRALGDLLVRRGNADAAVAEELQKLASR